MISRVTYLHLALQGEVLQFSRYSPTAARLSRAPFGLSVEEPTDEQHHLSKHTHIKPPQTEGAVRMPSKPGSDAVPEKEAPTESDSQTKKFTNEQASCPECWFEDEKSGVPLRWHLFVGILYDLVKGRALVNRSSRKNAANKHTQDNFLPWHIRVHFSSYPTDQLLPLDDCLDGTNCSNDGSYCITALLGRLFRNSLKQALFMQYGSSKVAMSINKSSHEQIWDSLLQSNYELYHDVNVRLQSGLKPFISTAFKDKQKDLPQTIPLRLMVNGMPAVQKPVKNENINGDEQKKVTETPEQFCTCQMPPPTTLGEVLAKYLPDHFAVDYITGTVTHDSNVYYCVQGIQPSVNCTIVDLWRTLSHPDHFLYITVNFPGRDK